MGTHCPTLGGSRRHPTPRGTPPTEEGTPHTTPRGKARPCPEGPGLACSAPAAPLHRAARRHAFREGFRGRYRTYQPAQRIPPTGSASPLPQPSSSPREGLQAQPKPGHGQAPLLSHPAAIFLCWFFSPSNSNPILGGYFASVSSQKKLKTPESVQQNRQKNHKQNKKNQSKEPKQTPKLPPKTYYSKMHVLNV